MPIGAITMILTNVGLQIYNNWCSSRQNARLQQKREEFERAARERNTQRMWQIMREGQELTKALEEDRHRQRIDELKNDIGSLLQKLAYTATINNWPLNVLPIVMKNQALGNILANQEESIALHCIFTPSNSNDFNKFVFPRIEEALESYCNQYWSIMSKHPILFYSGAWKSAQSPTGIQIDSMRTALSNLPVLVITPFFRPNDGKLVFQIRMWGVGASSTDEFSIPETVPTEFQRDYKIDDEYVKESEIIDELIEDIVPYLQCLIGYMADTYFWSSQEISPLLPLLITNGTINTDGMKYLIDNSHVYYNALLSESSHGTSLFSRENLSSFLESIVRLCDKEEMTTVFRNVFLRMCSKRIGIEINSWEDLYALISSDEQVNSEFYDFIILKDLSLIRELGLRKNVILPQFENLHNKLSHIDREQYEIIDTNTFEVDQLFRLANNQKEQAVSPYYFIFITWNPKVVIGMFCTEQYEPCVFSKGHTKRFFIVRHIESMEKYSDKDFQMQISGLKNSECKMNKPYYVINLNNNKLTKMKEKSFEKQFGQSFERIGKGLGKIFDGIINYDKDSTPENLWGERAGSQQTDSTERILSYFIANAGKTIPAERVENMSMQNVLNWVDNNVTPFVDKVYLIKGVNAEYNKHVFCVFFGTGENVLLQEGSPCICFITSQYNEEMKQTFKENNICVMPLK